MWARCWTRLVGYVVHGHAYRRSNVVRKCLAERLHADGGATSEVCPATRRPQGHTNPVRPYESRGAVPHLAERFEAECAPRREVREAVCLEVDLHLRPRLQLLAQPLVRFARVQLASASTAQPSASGRSETHNCCPTPSGFPR